MTKYVCSKTFSRENERQQCLSSDLEFFHHLILFVSRDVEQSYIPSFFYLTSSLLEVSYLVRQYIVKLKEKLQGFEYKVNHLVSLTNLIIVYHTTHTCLPLQQTAKQEIRSQTIPHRLTKKIL